MKQIKFTADMVQAIVDGLKTQTRRPFNLPKGWSWFEQLGGEQTGFACDSTDRQFHISELPCPFGQPGDLLCVPVGDLLQLVLKIKKVRVERVQAISESDAQAEGCAGDNGFVEGGLSSLDEFRQLWQSIYGIGSWESNAWVWVLDFDLKETIEIELLEDA